MSTFEEVGEQLRKNKLLKDRAQRRMRIWTTKHNNLSRKVTELQLKLSVLAKEKAKNVQKI